MPEKLRTFSCWSQTDWQKENFGEMRQSGRSQRFRTGELVPLVITLKAVGTMSQEIEETEIEPQIAPSEAAAASTPQS